MAKSVAVNVDITSIGENYKYVKYTYVYINDVDAKRKVIRDNESLKGYHKLGKPRFSSAPFPDGSGAFWYSEYIYEKD